MRFWSVTREWEGQTAFIVAGGTSVTQEMVDRLRGQRVVVVNTSHEKAPWADILFYGDPRWIARHYQVVNTFPGRIVTAKNPPINPHKQSQPNPDRILLLRKFQPPGLHPEPDGLRFHMTSLTGAIGLLVHLGVKRIVLLGADGKPGADGKDHHHTPHHVPQNDLCWAYWDFELWGLVEPLKAAGVEVINTNFNSAYRMFAFGDLDSILEGMNA